MEQTLQIDTRTEFGTRRAYPMNRQAGLIAELTGKRTITDHDILNCEALGFEFEAKQITGEFYPIAAEKLVTWLRGDA